ncbi:MAG TPA: ATP-binding protein [Candidatus Binatia bacterium]|nr:ATP-binding protein [Candidatus Binatia bacterium]
MTDRPPDACAGLLPAMRRLDRLLARAVAAAEAAYGPAAAANAYRGLYLGHDDVERLLAREPGVPALLTGAETGDPSAGDVRLTALQQEFGLSGFDVDAIVIALAPEIDLRYERIYGYLQDDVTRRRPSVDLIAGLLGDSPEGRFVALQRFAPHAPLVRHGLIHLLSDGGQRPLLAAGVALDDAVVRALLRHDGLDARLTASCETIAAIPLDAVPVAAETRVGVAALTREAAATRRPLRLYLEGPADAGTRQLAQGIAGLLGGALLAADVGRLLAAGPDFESLLALLFREARLRGAPLFLAGVDVLRGDERAPRLQLLLRQLAGHPGVAILAGERPWAPLRALDGGPDDVVVVELPALEFTERLACWRDTLAAAGVVLPDADVDALASRFRLTAGQVAGAVAAARSASRVSAPTAAPTSADLFAAARALSSRDLGALARKIRPNYRWDDIVLPADQLAQLREICAQARYRHVVFGDWGFGRKLSLGKGLNVLFSGPPGTGKTMAAEVIASELGLELFKIDLSQVVSKYIGETEKNLSAVFAEARSGNAILFFDEADALFGKRSEVRDAHDRYANIEIAFLLQKIEEYEGIAILATNLRQHLDEAFTRRLTFAVDFPFPDEPHRRLIWNAVWPRQAPLSTTLDLDFMARQFKLAGGSIKNVAVAAAFLAAEQGGAVTTRHLLLATRREFQKMGKSVARAALGAYREELDAAAGGTA